MIIQHFALVYRVHCVQLILHLRLEVGSDLLHLPPLLHAVDDDDGQQGSDWDNSTESSYQDGVST